MSPELSRRLGAAVGTRDVSVVERRLIVEAAEHAADWTDLPAGVQRLVESIEARPPLWAGTELPPPRMGVPAVSADDLRPVGRYLRVDDLPVLLRRWGLLPADGVPQSPATVNVRAAQQLLAALDDAPADADDGPNDDHDDDNGLDEDSQALLDALEEIDRLNAGGDAERALALYDLFIRDAPVFDPEKHPRWPKGTPKLGGKFKPSIAGLVYKIAKWLNGDHKGDPFDGFDKPVLRKVAKLRGLKVRPGADRDEIAKQLLNDLVKPRIHGGGDPQARKAMLQLAGGNKTTIASAQVDGLMQAIKTGQPEPFNLANLQVDGAGNGNLFQRHLRDRPRDTMPQLPTGFGKEGDTAKGRTMEDFEQFLADKGVKFEYGTMDPRQLVASQSELNAPKVAKLYGFMRDGGWLESGVMIVGRQGDEWAVVDGHHRWAGASLASIARGGTLDVKVMRIDASIDDILGTPENPDGIVMDFAEFEGLATDREG